MATSRTGTTQWIRVRDAAIRNAKTEGIDRCPFCSVLLDYDQGRQPNSAEVDHIVPHSKGGKDVLANTRVCCRRCNQSRGSRALPKAFRASIPSRPLKTSRQW
ncbi:HNH endonuclease [Sinomonas gamaensis]|uniref:HNH endonuclease n=1 Tax=Sinomonas gamaensis TaxID=2565624 RepID=UPI001108FD6A|nr:HNH endonuclease [Sinomonas gamaensis]